MVAAWNPSPYIEVQPRSRQRRARAHFKHAVVSPNSTSAEFGDYTPETFIALASFLRLDE